MKNKLFSTILVLLLTAFSLTLFGCDKSLNTYYIGVQTLHSKGYVIGGNETFKEGENVTLEAKEITNNENESNFLCWMLNNRVVGLQAKHEFVVSESTAGNYLAIFESPYIEYFNLSQINYSICTPTSNQSEEDNTISLVSLVIYAGSVENNLMEIYKFSNEQSNEQISSSETTELELTKEVIYPKQTDIFAFDMQEDIYLSIEVTYSQFNNEYTSKTRAKISATNNVEKEILEIDKNLLENDGLILTAPSKGEEFVQTSQNATFSLKFERLKIDKTEIEE